MTVWLELWGDIPQAVAEVDQYYLRSQARPDIYGFSLASSINTASVHGKKADRKYLRDDDDDGHIDVQCVSYILVLGFPLSAITIIQFGLCFALTPSSTNYEMMWNW